MQKHFPHILKQLISPQIQLQHSGGFINRYLRNRQNMKYCKKLWTGFSEDTLIHQGVNLRRQLKAAIDQQDKVLLLKVCSIPLYEKLKNQFKTLKLGSWGYHFQFLNIYRVQGTQKQYKNQHFVDPFFKTPEWVRVQFKFKEQLDDGKLVDRKFWIQRKIQQYNLPVQKKWYIHELEL